MSTRSLKMCVEDVKHEPKFKRLIVWEEDDDRNWSVLDIAEGEPKKLLKVIANLLDLEPPEKPKRASRKPSYVATY